MSRLGHLRHAPPRVCRVSGVNGRLRACMSMACQCLPQDKRRIFLRGGRHVRDADNALRRRQETKSLYAFIILDLPCERPKPAYLPGIFSSPPSSASQASDGLRQFLLNTVKPSSSLLNTVFGSFSSNCRAPKQALMAFGSFCSTPSSSACFSCRLLLVSVSFHGPGQFLLNTVSSPPSQSPHPVLRAVSPQQRLLTLPQRVAGSFSSTPSPHTAPTRLPASRVACLSCLYLFMVVGSFSSTPSSSASPSPPASPSSSWSPRPAPAPPPSRPARISGWACLR